MTNRERVRRVSILCCHCVRNIAYYRAGWTNDTFASSQDFWVNANSNFLDIAVLEWCKMFSEWNGKHHWRKVVPAPDEFRDAMFAELEISESDFQEYLKVTKNYRDKFVAHLDTDRRMNIPRLDLLVDSTVFFYKNILEQYSDYLHDAPQDLGEFFEERSEHGKRAYQIAT